MNALMKNQLCRPVSFATNRERIKLGRPKENRTSHTDAHCAVDIPRTAPAIGEDQS
jgi:hypothetical protein